MAQKGWFICKSYQSFTANRNKDQGWFPRNAKQEILCSAEGQQGPCRQGKWESKSTLTIPREGKGSLQKDCTKGQSREHQS